MVNNIGGASRTGRRVRKETGILRNACNARSYIEEGAMAN